MRLQKLSGQESEKAVQDSAKKVFNPFVQNLKVDIKKGRDANAALNNKLHNTALAQETAKLNKETAAAVDAIEAMIQTKTEQTVKLIKANLAKQDGSKDVSNIIGVYQRSISQQLTRLTDEIKEQITNGQKSITEFVTMLKQDSGAQGIAKKTGIQGDLQNLINAFSSLKDKVENKIAVYSNDWLNVGMKHLSQELNSIMSDKYTEQAHDKANSLVGAAYAPTILPGGEGTSEDGTDQTKLYNFKNPFDIKIFNDGHISVIEDILATELNDRYDTDFTFNSKNLKGGEELSFSATRKLSPSEWEDFAADFTEEARSQLSMY